MNYNWNWHVLLQEPYLQWLISGVQWTFQVAIAAWILAFSVGSVIGVMRTLPHRGLQIIAASYVELFRNIPLLVQIFLWYFVFPEIVPESFSKWLKRDMPNPEFITAAWALGLYTASRVAEQVRAGITSVAVGLAKAAYASGLSVVQCYRYILLPIAYRLVLPPLTSEFLTIFKNSSLALTIGVLELTAQSQQITEYTFQGFEAFTVATIIYVLIALLVTLIMAQLERTLKVPGFNSTERSS